ncbi:MAG: 4-hydroxybenzoate octaprenyltransferase [Gammaproteobacteria bacterium]|nr:4-hydroxybenzoate octaprenyltransferase [Gammaproteobacteria bacterium]
MSVANRIEQYFLLMRMDRPVGTFLLLWPTLWALWIAGSGQPDPYVVLVFVAGVFLMRSAGCVINDYADRKFDPLVERTRNRPIATGQVKPKEALILFLLLCLVAFALVLTLNRLTVLLSLAAVVLAICYPFLKRITHLPQVFLGVAFGWGVPMAFAAETGSVPSVAWVLMGANVLWAVAYDTMYAMVDREDDTKAGVKSTALLFGHYDRLIIGVLQVVVLLILVAVGKYLGYGAYYFGALGMALLFGVYQQFLIRTRHPARCLNAFLNNVWFGGAVFIGLVLQYLS